MRAKGQNTLVLAKAMMVIAFACLFVSVTFVRHMNTPTSFSDTLASSVDLSGLILAIANAASEDSLLNVLSTEQWNVLADYLHPVALQAGQVLFTQGQMERTLYLTESGWLGIYRDIEKKRLLLTTVGPGSVVGEGAFFSYRMRSATVQAQEACQLWGLLPDRFAVLSKQQPAIALRLMLAAGAVQTKRLQTTMNTLFAMEEVIGQLP